MLLKCRQGQALSARVPLSPQDDIQGSSDSVFMPTSPRFRAHFQPFSELFPLAEPQLLARLTIREKASHGLFFPLRAAKMASPGLSERTVLA